VFVAPVVVGVAGLLWLVVVASVRAGSLAPGVGFLVAGLGLLAVVRPLVTREVVTRALEALGRGDLDAAERGLRRIAGSRLASRASRAGASLNLALLALHRGDVDDAERWYVAAGAGAGAPWAATGLALCAVLRGRYDDAEQHLADAIARGRDRGVLREVDGVRALMVLRRDGAEAAAELGDRLISPEAGLLLRGVVAAARRRLGDSEGADVALGGLGRDDLVASGLAVAVPEIAEA
jgi:tetratricopeptide (TPR) repeat protein